MSNPCIAVLYVGYHNLLVDVLTKHWLIQQNSEDKLFEGF